MNINAEDFGIEIDRIVKIAPDRDSVFCDGEQTGNFLLNRLVGLFEVEKIEGKLDRSGHQFAPDRFYVSGREREADPLAHVIRKEIIPSFRRFRNSDEVAAFEAAIHRGQHLGLCPVARRILFRYAQRERAGVDHEPCVVFVSYVGRTSTPPGRSTTSCAMQSRPSSSRSTHIAMICRGR